jgi:hypothetical protein
LPALDEEDGEFWRLARSKSGFKDLFSLISFDDPDPCVTLNPFDGEGDILKDGGVIRFPIQDKDKNLLFVEGLFPFVRDREPNGGTSCRKREDFLADQFLSR